MDHRQCRILLRRTGEHRQCRRQRDRLGALRFAARPADANHPYGHEKAEFFAAVIEGVLIVVAALLIFEEAWQNWWHPHVLKRPLRASR